MLRKVFGGLMLAALATGLGACNGARDTAVRMLDKDSPRGFMTQTLTTGEGARQYAVFLPLNYDKNQKYPVILFLHGMGEGGTNDLGKPLSVGLAPFVADRAGSFPFICVFPQSSGGGWDENSSDARNAIAALDEVCAHYAVDKDRISVTGLSTGGYGSWAIGAKYKHKFAALVPMGSSASADWACDQLLDMPIWAFHNSGDPFAASWNDSGMVNKIKDKGGIAQYTEYAAGGHDCWDETYASGELFSWLQEQRLSNRTKGASPKAATPAAGKSTSSVTPIKANGRADVAAAVQP